jgi:hypothetical protein
MTGALEYARNGDVHLAYQVLGDGDRDVLLLTGGTIPMDALDQHPKGRLWSCWPVSKGWAG